MNDSVGNTTDRRPAWNKCRLNKCPECLSSLDTQYTRKTWQNYTMKKMTASRMQTSDTDMQTKTYVLSMDNGQSTVISHAVDKCQKYTSNAQECTQSQGTRKEKCK